MKKELKSKTVLLESGNYLKFFCVKCGNLDIAATMKDILEVEKVCYDCRSKEHILKKQESKIKSEEADPNRSALICTVCNCLIATKASKYCSTVCKKAGMKEKAFIRKKALIKSIAEAQDKSSRAQSMLGLKAS